MVFLSMEFLYISLRAETELRYTWERVFQLAFDICVADTSGLGLP